MFYIDRNQVGAVVYVALIFVQYLLLDRMHDRTNAIAADIVCQSHKV